MEMSDSKILGDHYEQTSSPAVCSEVDEYEFDYERSEEPANQNDIAYPDWSSPINDDGVPSRDETPTTSPPFSPPPPNIPKIAEKGKGPYFCDLCNKTFTNYGSYRRHLRMHYCEKKYTCHICGRQFFRRYLWVKHQEKIHGNDPSSCRCPHCGDWSKTPDLLREHLRTQHKRTNGCKENWTKGQGTFPKKNPADVATPVEEVVVPASTPKRSRKKRQPKEKRERKLTVPSAVVKQEVEIIPEVPDISPITEPEQEPEPIETKKPDTSIETENGFVDVEGGNFDETSTPNGNEFDAQNENDDSQNSQCSRNMSRYGRKRKQRVLFNADTYRASLKRFKRRPSISSPNVRRKSLEITSNINRNEPASIDDNKEVDNLPDSDKVNDNPVDKPEETIVELIVPKVERREIEVEESELSKLLQQALPSNGSMPKNVSHRGNFFCDKCRRFFINRSSYMRHKKMHTGVKPFTCEHCCLSFFRSESLTNHKKKHAKENFEEFRCHLCGYKAANCASLRNHFYSVCCRDKPSDKSNSTDMDESNADDESPTSPNGKGSRNIAGYCSLCNRAFFNASNYQKHAKLHSNMASAVPMQLTYTCTFCGKIFTNRAQYDGHVLAHSKEENAATNSEENGAPSSLEVLKLFGNFINQRRNNDTTEVESEVLVKDEPRDDAETNGDAYGSILRENPRVMCCRMCPLAFTDRRTFLTHQQTHHDRVVEQSYSFYCRFCGHPYKSKSDAQDHEGPCRETRKTENRLHHCYNCEVKFDNGSALREHVKAAHSNDRVELALRDSSEIIEDNDKVISDGLKYVKNDEKNAGKYRCGKCEETFADIQSVVSHIQKGHEDETLENPRVDTGKKSSWEVDGPSIMKQLLSSPPATSSRYAGISASTPVVPNKRGGRDNNNRSFACSLCLKSFDDPRVAEAHEQQAHVMVDWFQCALCEKTGGKKTMLSHMATHMLKIGSVVTTLGDQDRDFDENSNFGTRGPVTTSNEFKKPQEQRVPIRENNAPSFVSMFCQLCKKVISSLSTLERHRHASQDNNVSFPYVCCMPGCGKCFALKVEALAHLQTLHKGSLSLTPTIHPKPKAQNVKLPIKKPAPKPDKNRELLANAWRALLAGGVGPFSQSLVQLSMAVAGNESEGVRSSSNKKDAYHGDALESLASNGELTITKVSDVEEIMVEPFLDCVLGDENEPEMDGTPDAEESVVIPLSPTMIQEDSDDGDTVEDDSSPLKDPVGVLNNSGKVILQCDDCHSVFTNPCSWKRHRKLHLGIMKHKCSFCPRKFYRKDHCDKHVKTHENTNLPRRKKSPINIKIEPETL